MIKKIYLMLGGKCNFKCRHCLQHPVEIEDTHLSVTVVDYIKNLISKRDASSPKISIIFWGGEPLVYLDSIKFVVSVFGNKVDYALVTNGLLVDSDFVDYANFHNINVVLSNDGVNTSKIRGKNMLDDLDYVANFSRIKNKSIESVISAYNYDYVGLIDYLDGKFPGVNVTIDSLQLSWDMPSDIYSFDFKKYKKSLNDVSVLAMKDMLEGEETNYSRVFASALKHIARGGDTEFGFPNCRQVVNSMNIDLSGNVFVCHNSSVSIGTISDSHETLVARYREWISTKRDKKCLSCPVFGLCSGGCPLVSDDLKLREKQCEIYRCFYNAAYELADRLYRSVNGGDVIV